MPHQNRLLTPEQFLLTLMAQLAIVALHGFENGFEATHELQEHGINPKHERVSLIAARAATTPSCGAVSALRAPWKEPMGVRRAATM